MVWTSDHVSESRQDAYDHGSGKRLYPFAGGSSPRRGYQRNNHQMDSDGAFFKCRGRKGPENTSEWISEVAEGISESYATQKEAEKRKKEIEYKYVPGPFMRTLVKALKSGLSSHPEIHLLIIEEINRANVAAVFGDVFQLLDRKNNVSEYFIQTSEDMRKYLADEFNGNPNDFETIKVPDNMYIWATMNSADQGVYPMDTAFKRRWNFTYLGINNNENIINDKEITFNGKPCKWNNVRKSINNYLSLMNINEDKLIGPFFIKPEDITDDRFDEVFKNKVLMYLFEDAGKQRRNRLFKNKSNIYSLICKEYDEKKFDIFEDELLRILNDYKNSEVD